MNVKVVRVTNRVRRHRPTKGGSTLDKAYARAFVDGFLVTCTEGKGWACSCLDDECEHPDAFAALLDPSILAVLDGNGDDE